MSTWFEIRESENNYVTYVTYRYPVKRKLFVIRKDFDAKDWACGMIYAVISSTVAISFPKLIGSASNYSKNKTENGETHNTLLARFLHFKWFVLLLPLHISVFKSYR